MHTLICGASESGKTSCGRRLSELHHKQGFGILVLTPLWERWTCDFQTTDAEEFLEHFWKSEKCVAFIDEGAETVGKYDDAMIATATRGRHWGHSVYYLVQTPTAIDYRVRNQCSQLICFAIDTKSARILADEFICPEIAEKAPGFPQGKYIMVQRFGLDGKKIVREGVLW